MVLRVGWIELYQIWQGHWDRHRRFRILNKINAQFRHQSALKAKFRTFLPPPLENWEKDERNLLYLRLSPTLPMHAYIRIPI